MLLLVGFAFLAGVVTVLSPCILPVLPVVLSGSVGGGKARPWGIISGFIASFTIFTLTLSSIVQALHISPDILRWVAAVLVILFGVVMVVPFLKDRFMALAAKLTTRTTTVSRPGRPSGGYWSGLVLGLSLGLVWTPCVGPIMASVISLALSQSIDAGSVLITIAYSLGTAVPLFLIMQGGRALLNKFPFFTKHSGSIQKVFGALMLLTGLAIFTGVDRNIQTWLLQTFPNYGSGLTAIEDQSFIKQEIKNRQATLETKVETIAGADILTLGSGAWINSAPLTLSGLKGKVVLVDIWTYSCINCLRTLPYLKVWYQKYKDQGLEIVGVHSPEFAFEKVEANVRKATVDLGVTWPVVQDNNFGIWNAYHNEYWPAHYLYDRNGTLIETHFGEGAYAETEAKIQQLLGQSGPIAAQTIAATQSVNEDRSPETYLGFQRGRRLSSPEDIAQDQAATYSFPAVFKDHNWAFAGKWTIGQEASTAEVGSSLAFRFKAAKVYLVINPLPGGSGDVQVSVDGKPVTGGDVKNGRLQLDGNRLYTLVDGSVFQSGLVKLEFKGRAMVYAFTFG